MSGPRSTFGQAENIPLGIDQSDARHTQFHVFLRRHSQRMLWTAIICHKGSELHTSRASLFLLCRLSTSFAHLTAGLPSLSACSQLGLSDRGVSLCYHSPVPWQPKLLNLILSTEIKAWVEISGTCNSCTSIVNNYEHHKISNRCIEAFLSGTYWIVYHVVSIWSYSTLHGGIDASIQDELLFPYLADECCRWFSVSRRPLIHYAAVLLIKKEPTNRG